LILCVLFTENKLTAEGFEKSFNNPLVSARPKTYYNFLNGNVNLFQISFELKELKKNGGNRFDSLEVDEIFNAGLCLDKVISHFMHSHNYFKKQSDVFGNYTLEISIESILDYTLLTGDSIYLPTIRRIFEKRNYNSSDTISFKSLPFSNPYFSYYLLHKNPDFIAPFLYESQRMKKEIKRTPEGAICIQTKSGDCNMLIDYLQEYASRMSKAGYLSNDSNYYKECVDQFRIYRNVLQDKNNGLYSQGRGWMDDKNNISPGIWSRGQGWLLRGMVTSLMYMPVDSKYYKELIFFLKELANGLLEKQDNDGMWHTLLHLPQIESFPETSGTGMIAGYLAIAYHKGFLSDKKYKDAALKAVTALIPYLGKDGEITYVSKGPGPLSSIDDYKGIGTDKHHGMQAAVYAFTGSLLLNK